MIVVDVNVPKSLEKDMKIFKKNKQRYF